jgi:hypothetical protein
MLSPSVLPKKDISILQPNRIRQRKESEKNLKRPKIAPKII